MTTKMAEDDGICILVMVQAKRVIHSKHSSNEESVTI